ncbi:MAG: hypothetical protein RL514_4528 [Verrucomicrobiota bacterium]
MVTLGQRGFDTLGAGARVFSGPLREVTHFVGDDGKAHSGLVGQRGGGHLRLARGVPESHLGE